MTTRDAVYSLFGPMLLEALTDVIMDEINILREAAGLQPRTKQQLLEKLKTKNDEAIKYDWVD
jgi:hypothetical protein